MRQMPTTETNSVIRFFTRCVYPRPDLQEGNLLQMKPIIIILTVMVFFLSPAAPKKLDSVGVYWGQDGPEEGTLRSACSTGRYSIIIMVSQTDIGLGRTPKLNFTDHCNPTNNTCNLSDDIRSCQKLGIKVILDIRSYSLSSRDDAKNFARDLLNILGDAGLDGIHFMTPQDLQYNDDLAISLSNYNNTSSSTGKLYLGAAHPCPPPGSTSMGRAIDTGLFDFVSVESYSTTNSRQCDYNGNISEFMNSWEIWTAKIPAGKIYLGLPASPQVAERGFISPEVLKSEILPVLTKSPKFAGVMLSSKLGDDKTGYTDQITTSVR